MVNLGYDGNEHITGLQKLFWALFVISFLRMPDSCCLTTWTSTAVHATLLFMWLCTTTTLLSGDTEGTSLNAAPKENLIVKNNSCYISNVFFMCFSQIAIGIKSYTHPYNALLAHFLIWRWQRRKIIHKNHYIHKLKTKLRIYGEFWSCLLI